MKLDICKRFTKDLKKIKDKTLNKRLKAKLEEIKKAVENTDPDELPEIKEMLKMESSEDAYRIKVGQSHRIGAFVEKNDKIEEDDKRFFSLKRFLHRKDIYRNFP